MLTPRPNARMLGAVHLWIPVRRLLILLVAIVLMRPATTAADVPVENPAFPEPAPREVPEYHAAAFTDADLAPYLGEAPAQAAKKLFDAGRYLPALIALQKLPAQPAT